MLNPRFSAHRLPALDFHRPDSGWAPDLWIRRQQTHWSTSGSSSTTNHSLRRSIQIRWFWPPTKIHRPLKTFRTEPEISGSDRPRPTTFPCHRCPDSAAHRSFTNPVFRCPDLTSTSACLLRWSRAWLTLRTSWISAACNLIHTTWLRINPFANGKTRSIELV